MGRVWMLAYAFLVPHGLLMLTALATFLMVWEAQRLRGEVVTFLRPSGLWAGLGTAVILTVSWLWRIQIDPMARHPENFGRSAFGLGLLVVAVIGLGAVISVAEYFLRGNRAPLAYGLWLPLVPAIVAWRTVEPVYFPIIGLGTRWLGRLHLEGKLKGWQAALLLSLGVLVGAALAIAT